MIKKIQMLETHKEKNLKRTFKRVKKRVGCGEKAQMLDRRKGITILEKGAVVLGLSNPYQLFSCIYNIFTNHSLHICLILNPLKIFCSFPLASKLGH